MENHYWRVKEGVGKYYYIVYTEQVRPKVKTKVQPEMVFRHEGGKVKAFQYKVLVGSELQKQLFAELKLKSKDRREEYE